MGIFEFVLLVIVISCTYGLLGRYLDLRKARILADADGGTNAKLDRIQRELEEVREILADILLDVDAQRRLDEDDDRPLKP